MTNARRPFLFLWAMLVALCAVAGCADVGPNGMPRNPTPLNQTAGAFGCLVLHIGLGCEAIGLGGPQNSSANARTTLPTAPDIRDEDFRLDERERFEDRAAEHLPRTRRAPGLAPHWIDASHLLMNAPADKTPPLVRTLGVDDGQLHDTPYRGNLACVSDGHVLLLSKDADRQDLWLQGEFGTELAGINFPRLWGRGLIGAACEPPHEVDQWTKEVQLRAADGLIEMTRSAPGASNTLLTHVSGQGRRGAALSVPWQAYSQARRVEYLPWSGLYVIRGQLHAVQEPAGAFIDAASGSLSTIVAPAFVQDLVQADDGFAWPIATRAGIAWWVQVRRWHKQGLFLDRDGRLERLDDGYARGSTQVSPDGCRLAYLRRTGDALSDWNSHETEQLAILDVCRPR